MTSQDNILIGYRSVSFSDSTRKEKEKGRNSKNNAKEGTGDI